MKNKFLVLFFLTIVFAKVSVRIESNPSNANVKIDGEPFGLTPIEAFAVGTPALFVDEGGFQDTIVDGVNGRLLSRDDAMAWQEALNEALEADIKKKWSKAGREKIAELDLSPDAHAKRIFEVIKELNES